MRGARDHRPRWRPRPRTWSAVAVAATSLFYFGGALVLRQIDAGYMLGGWLALGPLALVAWNQHRTAE